MCVCVCVCVCMYAYMFIFISGDRLRPYDAVRPRLAISEEKLGFFLATKDIHSDT